MTTKADIALTRAEARKLTDCIFDMDLTTLASYPGLEALGTLLDHVQGHVGVDGEPESITLEVMPGAI